MRNFLVALALLTAGAAQAQQPIRKISFTPGQQLQKATVSKMTIEMDMMGMPLTIDQNVTITADFTINKSSAKDFSATSKIKRIVASMNGMGQDMSFDSDKPEDRQGEMGKVMGEKLDKPVTVTVDANGIITAVDSSAVTASPATGGMMDALALGTPLGDPKPGGQYELIAKLPARTLKVGESWADSTVDKDGKATTTYLVKELTKGQVVIAINGILSRAGTIDQMGMSFNLDLKGTTEGQLIADTATGLVKSRQLKGEAKGTLEASGQTIPLNMKYTSDENVTK
ncbi:MAG: DUF6263 family protein [Candidatus Pseudobacter hemicellulosilyticus]|uniref:DUF6263 family protein n=1 Tax=Candidatus Pseudobacter hemicellulosilyticus TaxID=3121375 RepID=A0AAJ6BJ52_9BACT|nr:MAG: DUF6263 family protein [Pseudobacter sp.]